jgi:hypothetical protein
MFILTEEIKEEIESHYQVLVKEFLYDNSTQLFDFEPYGDTEVSVNRGVSDEDYSAATEDALSRFENGFEEENNWICSSQFRDGEDYETAKNLIINYVREECFKTKK